jgi:hypothetical protein
MGIEDDGPSPEGQPLVLRNEDWAAKTEMFYKELKADEGLQREFINNPAELIAKRFLPPNVLPGISPQRISTANRVLYSVVANDGFRNWAQSYQARIEEVGWVDKAQIVKDFSSAIVHYGDVAFVQALMEGTASEGGGPSKISVLYVYDIVVAIEVAAICIIGAVCVIGIARKPDFSPADFRTLTESLIARARELDRSGALGGSFMR